MKILDISAGNRGIWFDKEHPCATFVDVRPEVKPDFVTKPWKNFADDDVRRIRSLKGIANVKAVAAEYDVKPNVIYKIWSGHSRPHVT